MLNSGFFPAARLQLRIDCEAFTKASTLTQEAKGITANSLESLTAVQEAVIVSPKTSNQPQTVDTTGLGSEKDGNGGVSSAQDFLNVIELKYFRSQDLNGENVSFVDSQSLINIAENIIVETLDEPLWEDYFARQANEMTQKFTLTGNMLKEVGLMTAKLATTIVKEAYRAYRKHSFDSGIRVVM